MSLFIFDAPTSLTPIPEGFQAVTIRIDAGLNSDLRWKSAAGEARTRIEQGARLFWELDFGFSGPLHHPLSHTSQFLSFRLAIDHFRNLFWPEFGAHSCGISLYRGSLDFSRTFVWDTEQESHLQSNSMPPPLFCRNVVVEYLSLLANQLPREAMACLLLDASDIDDSVLEAYLLSKEYYSCFSLFLKNSRFPNEGFGWDNSPGNAGFLGTAYPSMSLPVCPKIGLCIPVWEASMDFSLFRTAMEHLEDRSVPFRLLPESLIAAEWEGLDHILFPEGRLSRTAQRMIQGFCAAGGEALPLDRFASIC